MWKVIQRLRAAQADKELHENLKFQTLVNVVADLVFTTDEKGVFDPKSRREWKKLTGEPHEPENYQRIASIHPDDKERVWKVWSDSLEKGTGYRVHYRVWVAAKNEFRYMDSRASPLPSKTLPAKEWIGLLTDIDEHYKIKEALEESLKISEHASAITKEANRSKSEFLAVMSHELRTPLTAILGFGELLNDEKLGPLSPLQKDSVKRMGFAGKHLMLLIEQILDYSGIEAGKFTLQSEMVSVDRILQEACDITKHLVLDKKIDIQCDSGNPLVMITDTQKLSQILINLMANAIKFTDKGSIISSVVLQGNDIVFKIIDTGVGIPIKHQERIFDQFWQVEQGLTRKVGGIGLGLTITKRLVEVLGGKIYLESISALDSDSKSPGTTFTVVLPRGIDFNATDNES